LAWTEQYIHVHFSYASSCLLKKEKKKTNKYFDVALQYDPV